MCKKTKLLGIKKGYGAGSYEVINQGNFKSFEFSDQQQLGCCVGSLQPLIHGS